MQTDMGSCSVAGCLRPSKHFRGHCDAHYQQMRKHGRILSVKPMRHRTLEEKLEAYSTPEPNTGCHLWFGMTDRVGRARAQKGNMSVYVSRWILGLLDKPSSTTANHKCHNVACVNQDHLYVGTQKQNIHDMIRAGRAAWQKGGVCAA